MNKIVLIILFSTCLFAQSKSDIIITEIMFRPVASNSEFIELYNSSVNESVDLSNYQIQYYKSSADKIIDHGSGITLKPHQFAVVLEGDYNFSSGPYINIIPKEALILTIDDNALGSSGMANTSDRTVRLLSPGGDTLASRTYTANNSSGISDEKIILSSDNNDSNWENSLAQNGTPGFINSVSPLNYDLQLSSIEFDPPFPHLEDNVTISIKIINKGLTEANNFKVEIYNDSDKDTLAESHKKIFGNTFASLRAQDSMKISTIINNVEGEQIAIIAKVIFALDQNRLNDSVRVSVSILPRGYDFSDLVINEIMYKPSSGEPEWIELFNNSEKTVNIKDWEISDPSNNSTISQSSLFINPKGYLVISDDDAISDFFVINSQLIIINIPSLNNSGDKLKLKDGLGNIIDSLNYMPSWGNNNKGTSLERVTANGNGNDSTNWASSISKFFATPGQINSVTPKNIDLSITNFHINSKYVEIGSNVAIFFNISNLGILNATDITARLFDDTNKDGLPETEEKIDSLNIASLNSNSSITVNFNYTPNSPGKVNLIVGIYQIDDGYTDNNTNILQFNSVELNEMRNDLIINEIMYAPSEHEPEWIEIYNKSNKTINIKNYRISDSFDTNTVIYSNGMLYPDSFYTFAKDSSFYSKYGNVLNSTISYFPTLNNSQDVVIILDSLSRIIDSVSYRSSWGGNFGKSLERINPASGSNDSTNWGSSILGSTPSGKNSISLKDFNIEIDSTYTAPEIPVLGSNVKISTVIKNTGLLKSNYSVQLYADSNHDQIADELLETENNLSLLPNNSSVIDFTYQIESIQKDYYFIITAILQGEKTANDSQYLRVRPAYGINAVQINEFMFRPQNGEPEWIELFNSSKTEINLKNWTIGDLLTRPSSTIISDGDLIIPPEKLLLISKDSSIFSYHSKIPSEFVAASIPNLNNDLDGIVIKDHYGLTIDSLKYNTNWANKIGYSLERVSLDSASTDSTNWMNSQDIEQSTPGRLNSVTQKKYDLRLSEVFSAPPFPEIGENFTLNSKVINKGIFEALNFNIKFSYGQMNSMMTLETIHEQNLLPGDSMIISTNKTIKFNGTIIIAAEIIFDNDSDISNNYLSTTVTSGYSKNSMLLSEIMAAPLSGKPEWIELKNVTDDKINLQNWAVENLMPTPSFEVVSDSSVIVNPNQYLVLSNASTFELLDSNSIFLRTNIGSLNNIADGIIIYDFRGAVIDSLLYDSSFDIEKGISLERISFEAPTNKRDNWISSIEPGGGSPGFNNSVSKLKTLNWNQIVINEIMYNPEIDNSEFIELYNNSESDIELGGMKIYDSAGNSFKLSPVTKQLQNGQYFVIAADSSILDNYSATSYSSNYFIKNSPSLNLSNSKDLVLLVDAFNNPVDSVEYSDSWNNHNIEITKNKSLERLNPNLKSNNPSNWSTSVSEEGATPLEKNSIFVNEVTTSTEINISPNPFSPDNDGFEDYSIIHYNLTQFVAQIRIKIYDSHGRRVRTLANNTTSASSGSVIFDGLDDNGNPLRIGIYIVFLEALNSSTGVVETLKKPIVIARKL